MTFYQRELNRIREICYANPAQIQAAINTRNYIEHNFNQALNLTLLSHIHFTSKFHLLRLFKKYYGMTPKQYLINIRMEKSRDYLKNGMAVTETCFAVGFDSPSSFSTLFKRKNGLAPVEFQKRAIFTK